MAGIPYYSIVPCCPSSGTALSFFNFPIVGGAPVNGVYSYIGDETTINGITFTPAYCYTITQIGSVFTTYPEAPSLDDFSPIVDGCEDLTCECDVDAQSYYTLNNCCTNEPYTVDGDILYIEYENFCYPDLCPIDLENVIITSISNEGAGGIFLEGCFNLTSVPNPGPANVIYSWGSVIQEVTTVPVCADCQDCFQCYTLYACDGSTFNTTTDLSANVGTYIRIEDDPKTWYVIEDPTKTICDNAIDVVLDTVSVKTPCVLTCYQVTGTPATVTYMNADYDIITVIGATRVCSYITPIVTGAGSGFVVELGLCVDGECPEICFEFTNCQTGEVLVVSNSPTVIPYYAQEQIVTLQGYDGCWSIDITEVCECPVSVTVLTAYASCPACLPIVNYKFTNCNNQSIIRYSIEDYSAYVGKTVELECGECWFVSEIDYIPPSTQSIVILYTFDNCTACNRTYYKLTDCLDPTNVTYTYTDLSSVIPTPIGCDCISVTYQFLGEEPITIVVNNRSGDFTFSLYPPPPLGAATNGWIVFIDNVWIVSTGGLAPSGIAQATLYENIACPLGTYTIEEDSIFESFVVEPCGSLPVIKIKGCDTCFTVEETREPINAGIVTVTDSYLDCPECLETFPCVCNRITNQGTIAKDFTYLDCLFDEVTINLQPNETSEKVCLINWVLTPEEEALVYIEHFGDCINGQCPVVPLPKRKVKPGYSTPTCDIEKYEKITCRSSEILYKQVMRLRYGLTNCCPEDDEKWLIKKELIDLDALRDPDYICKPVTSCCNQPINDCGCNTLKTCNS